MGLNQIPTAIKVSLFTCLSKLNHLIATMHQNTVENGCVLFTNFAIYIYLHTEEPIKYVDIYNNLREPVRLSLLICRVIIRNQSMVANQLCSCRSIAIFGSMVANETLKMFNHWLIQRKSTLIPLLYRQPVSTNRFLCR